MARIHDARRKPRLGIIVPALSLSLLLSVANAAGTQSVLPGDDQVVASRGGVDVTYAEIDARIMELPKALRGSYMNDPERIEEVVSNLLLEKQLAAKAKEIAADDPYLELQMEQARTRFLATRVRTLLEEAIPVPDFDALAEEKYLVNPEKYSGKTMLELTHILVTDRGRTDEQARARAEEVRKLALEGKRPFADLVAEYTDEKKQGVTSTGQLAKVIPGVMVPEFDKAAFALKQPGDISEVVKTRYGYHVIRLEQRNEAKLKTFEQVKSQIVEELRREFIARQKSTVVDELRSMPIQASPERVASLRTRYTAEGPKPASDATVTAKE
jgi:peptidyl-prolyl cis-trans isomerase C